jgi:hypothetical protein
VAGIDIGYGLLSPVLESRYGREIFLLSKSSRPTLLLTHLPFKGQFFPGGKAARARTNPSSKPFIPLYALLALKRKIFAFIIIIIGAHGGVVVKALRYKAEGRGFDSRWCRIFFIDILLPFALWPWG